MASKWVDSKKVIIASGGGTTLAHCVSVADEAEINGELLKDYLKRTKKVKAAAKKIGKVEVDHGNTACKTPEIIATIEKIEGKDRIGRKRKAARC